ncbi:hypothetical protein [Pseudotabrizicola sp.]|uniref:hypothetical protein n=1 Tax=Pseudotabrizicola sp. TaxID=2939647 RepID=UPI002715FBF4|nr:hypothetical protein [Pseudotabrizicola sp.]MDO8884301.1 hypothetical protein [Pseudotabrizicola sp.]
MVTHGDVTVIGCEDSLLRSDTQGVELVGIGLTNMIVVAIGDAILVAHKSRVQEVKEAVARLSARSIGQSEGLRSRITKGVVPLFFRPHNHRPPIAALC